MSKVCVLAKNLPNYEDIIKKFNPFIADLLINNYVNTVKNYDVNNITGKKLLDLYFTYSKDRENNIGKLLDTGELTEDEFMRTLRGVIHRYDNKIYITQTATEAKGYDRLLEKEEVFIHNKNIIKRLATKYPEVKIADNGYNVILNLKKLGISEWENDIINKLLERQIKDKETKREALNNAFYNYKRVKNFLPVYYAKEYLDMYKDIPLVKNMILEYGNIENLSKAITENIYNKKGKIAGFWKRLTRYVYDLFRKSIKNKREEELNLLSSAFFEDINLNEINKTFKKILDISKKEKSLKESKKGVSELFDSNFAIFAESKTSDEVINKLLANKVIDKKCS